MPDPHPQLTREQAVLYRQLQTNSVLTPALARFICPDVYESTKCSVCNSATATLTHVLWDCKLNPEEAAAYTGRLPTDIARTHPTGPRGDSLVENVGSPGVSVETQLDDCTYIVVWQEGPAWHPATSAGALIKWLSGVSQILGTSRISWILRLSSTASISSMSGISQKLSISGISRNLRMSRIPPILEASRVSLILDISRIYRFLRTPQDVAASNVILRALAALSWLWRLRRITR
ncbi:hypothetical protein HPB49_012879 [Dermacentor silvarum]|uniref:Uncharacterized protein n=1 Tax=Dermacentor silvarum TaxID=543639 RepID=A0ACB8C9H6_DERSI|nr:hypothetical protein HPB49_012879 [Dermacentor silvarum]